MRRVLPCIVDRPRGAREAQPGHAVVLAGRRARDGAAGLEDAGDDGGVDGGDGVRIGLRGRGRGRGGLFVGEVVRLGAACEGQAGYGDVVLDGDCFAGKKAILWGD